MSKKEFGRAQYKAIRNGDLVTIFATGVAPGMNVKTDIEELPIKIYPQMYGFYFVIPDIVLPALRPFTYEEDVAFPKPEDTITICDADGKHSVQIEDANIPAILPAHPGPSKSNYCVFSWIGTVMLEIAECDAILPAVYSRVFGPATFNECKNYIDNGGI